MSSYFTLCRLTLLHVVLLYSMSSYFTLCRLTLSSVSYILLYSMSSYFTLCRLTLLHVVLLYSMSSYFTLCRPTLSSISYGVPYPPPLGTRPLPSGMFISLPGLATVWLYNVESCFQQHYHKFLVCLRADYH